LKQLFGLKIGQNRIADEMTGKFGRVFGKASRICEFLDVSSELDIIDDPTLLDQVQEFVGVSGSRHGVTSPVRVKFPERRTLERTREASFLQLGVWNRELRTKRTKTLGGWRFLSFQFGAKVAVATRLARQISEAEKKHQNPC
jgi:hypothetical protein